MSLDPEPPPLTPAPEAGSALAADAVAAHATDPRAGGHGHHGPFHTHCENCGTKLEGPFCHRCGQHDFEFHRSFWHVFLEALENFFHFDSKLFRDTVTLLFHPGRLTAAFNAGKRAAQMPPFRLYVFVSFIFFAIQFLGTSSRLGQPVVLDPPAAASAPAEVPGAKPAAATPPSVQVAGPLKLSLAEGNDTAFERYMNEKGRRALSHPDELKDAFLHAIPKMLLVCLPVFALLTRLLFRKSGLVYLQHLVLSLHFHTFIYLFLLFRQGWVGLFEFFGWSAIAGLVSFAATLWLMIYPLLMLRHLFANSWAKTIVKTGLLGGLYAFALGTVFLAGVMLIFLNY